MSTDWLYGALPAANSSRNWLYGVVRKKSARLRTEPASDDGQENICPPSSRTLRSNSFSQVRRWDLSFIEETSFVHVRQTSLLKFWLNRLSLYISCNCLILFQRFRPICPCCMSRSWIGNRWRHLHLLDQWERRIGSDQWEPGLCAQHPAHVSN